MSFTLPDLVVEGAIRKGFDFLRNNAGNEGVPAVPSNEALVLPTATINSIFTTIPNQGPGNRLNFTLMLRLRGYSLVSLTGNSSATIVNTSNLDLITISTSDTFTSFSSYPGTFNPVLGEVSNAIILAIDAVTPIPNTDDLNFNIRVNVGPQFDEVDWIDAIIGVNGGNNNTVNFTFTGLLGKASDIGAGGEVLNMLFDFEAASDSKDGGIPSSVSGKYTQEPVRIREFFRNNEVAIVQSFSDVQANLPCISIQLANDGEDQGLALTDDFGGIEAFDSNNGIGRDESTIHANTTINVGIHTKEQLLTKYIYHITKYFILSAKEDLIRQNFIIATFKGSDFTRDASWQGDHVYTRFLNVSGKTEDSWVNLDEIVVALEEVGVQIFVPQDGTNNTFINGSPIFSSITTSNASIQLPNSVYFPAEGMAVLIQRDGTGKQLFQTAEFNFTNVPTTGILTATNIDFAGNDYEIITTGDVTAQRYLEIQDSDGVTVPAVSIPTITTPPASGLVESQSKQNINDANDVLHRSNINEGTI